MEKLCIDVRGFSVEKKKRVQDAFFELGYDWYEQGHDDDKYLNKTQCDDCKVMLIDDDGDLVYDTVTHQPNITYTDLMRKAGMDESDPDARHSLQPGDYTTREEIKAYAEREGIELKEAYRRICDAFITAGADEGVGAICWSLFYRAYGWDNRSRVLFHDEPIDNFTRHLTPDQILGAEPSAADVIISTPTKEGLEADINRVDAMASEPTVEIELVTDLQSVISDYLFLLDSIKDPYARGVIKSQITDLTDLQYKQLSGENNNA